MRVVNRIRVAAALAKRRKQNHADRAVASRRLVPGDEQSAAVLVSVRIQDSRNFVGQPSVALRHRVIQRRAGVVHVVAQVRRDEVVLRHRAVTQIGRQLRVRPDVGDAVGGIRVVSVRNVVEIDKRIVLRSVVAHGGERAGSAGNILLVRLPGDAGVFELGHQVQRSALVIHAGIAVVENAEIIARLEPEIVGQAGMNTGRIEVLLGMRSHRKQRVVDVRRRRISFDLRPVVIFHQDDENRLDGTYLSLCGAGQQKQRQQYLETHPLSHKRYLTFGAASALVCRTLNRVFPVLQSSVLNGE